MAHEKEKKKKWEQGLNVGKDRFVGIGTPDRFLV
jgi:hypothetical protein